MFVTTNLWSGCLSEKGYEPDLGLELLKNIPHPGFLLPNAVLFL